MLANSQVQEEEDMLMEGFIRFGGSCSLLLLPECHLKPSPLNKKKVRAAGLNLVTGPHSRHDYYNVIP